MDNDSLLHVKEPLSHYVFTDTRSLLEDSDIWERSIIGYTDSRT